MAGDEVAQFYPSESSESPPPPNKSFVLACLAALVMVVEHLSSLNGDPYHNEQRLKGKRILILHTGGNTYNPASWLPSTQCASDGRPQTAIELLFQTLHAIGTPPLGEPFRRVPALFLEQLLHPPLPLPAVPIRTATRFGFWSWGRPPSQHCMASQWRPRSLSRQAPSAPPLMHLAVPLTDLHCMMCAFHIVEVTTSNELKAPG